MSLQNNISVMLVKLVPPRVCEELEANLKSGIIESHASLKAFWTLSNLMQCFKQV